MSEQKQASDIPLDDDDTTILTVQEPNFQRFYARGSILQISDEDPDTVQLGFWSQRDADIELEDGGTGTGYRLESEAVMTWRAAKRLRDLLDWYIDENEPDDMQTTDS